MRDVLLIKWFFFFQAEDGIRDLVRSRGLGDVYKRQGHYLCAGLFIQVAGRFISENQQRVVNQRPGKCDAVSYTHLTLPTSDLV